MYLPVQLYYRDRETAVSGAKSNCLPHTIQAVLNMNKEKQAEIHLCRKIKHT